MIAFNYKKIYYSMLDGGNKETHDSYSFLIVE